MVDIASIGTSPRSGATTRPALLGVLVALAIALTACSGSNASEDKALPDAKLTDLSTGDAAGWDADGKPMVVNFWASWCTPCRKEMPAFDQVHQDLGDQVAIVGVTDEADLDAARKAAAAADVSYPLLVDEEQSLLIDLGITGLPGTVFVDADGNVVGRHLGAMTEDELTKEIEERYGITA